MVCKKAKDLLQEKKRLQRIKNEDEENKEADKRVIEESFLYGICPECGSTKIKKIYLGGGNSPYNNNSRVQEIEYKSKCCECGCTSSSCYIDDLRWELKKKSFFKTLFTGMEYKESVFDYIRNRENYQKS